MAGSIHVEIKPDRRPSLSDRAEYSSEEHRDESPTARRRQINELRGDEFLLGETYKGAGRKTGGGGTKSRDRGAERNMDGRRRRALINAIAERNAG